MGALFYEKCKHISRDVEDAENLATLLQSGVGGQIRISTSLAFGRRIMVPPALRYLREHPAVRIDLGFDDRYVDMVEQGVDLAIRMGHLADSSLGARYLGTNPWVMVASSAYLAVYPAPRVPADLAEHHFVIYSSVQGDDRWVFTGPGGEEVSVPVTGRLRTNNLSAVLAATRAGMGLAVLPWYVARESVADASLTPVLNDYTLPAQEMHPVYPSPKLMSTKVTSVVAYLQQALAGDWWRQPPSQTRELSSQASAVHPIARQPSRRNACAQMSARPRAASTRFAAHHANAEQDETWHGGSALGLRRWPVGPRRAAFEQFDANRGQ